MSLIRRIKSLISSKSHSKYFKMIQYSALVCLGFSLIIYQNCSGMTFTEASVVSCNADEVQTVGNICVNKENVCEFNGRYLGIGELFQVCESDQAPTQKDCKCGEVSCQPDKTLSGPTNYKYPTCQGTDSPLNGVCGGAQNKYEKPSTDFCDAGTYGNDLTANSNGTWKWTCKGANGGSTVDCMNLLGKSIAECGSANGKSLNQTPNDNELCLQKNTSTKKSPFTGPWEWTCTSEDGSQTKSCKATKETTTPVNAVCGLDSNLAYPDNSPPPITNLCLPGIYKNGSLKKSADGTKWEWTCDGINGGQPVSCSVKAVSSQQPKCGTDNGGSFKTEPANKCPQGVNPTGVQSNSTTWNWNCAGISCYALKIIDGECVIYQAPIETLPSNSASLCKSGIPNNQSGTNTEWKWTCDGINGGTPKNCTAPRKLINQCGADHLGYFNTEPTNKCPQGVNPNALPFNESEKSWNWTCGSANCKAYKKINAACVTYANPLDTIPTANTALCNPGTAQSTPSRSGDVINWVCNGLNQGSPINCSANMKPLNPPLNGECLTYGSGVVFNNPPGASQRCKTGNPSNTTDWTWICNGVNGGAQSPTCTAPHCTQEEVLNVKKTFVQILAIPEGNIARSCIDGAVPIYENNLPGASASSYLRFFNTCGRRHCQTLKDTYGRPFISGRVIEYLNGMTQTECRGDQLHPTITDACKQRIANLPKPINLYQTTETIVAANCLANFNENLQTRLRTTFTCANRFCLARGHSYGRIVENSYGNLTVECYNEEILSSLQGGTLVYNFDASFEAIGTSCKDGAIPIVKDNYAFALPEYSTWNIDDKVRNESRFISTCANRHCRNVTGQSGTSAQAVEWWVGLPDVRSARITCIKDH